MMMMVHHGLPGRRLNKGASPTLDLARYSVTADIYTRPNNYSNTRFE
jgi:hypothetical protein